MFLKNCWYVPATPGKVAEGHTLTRRILGEPILMYLTAEGAPVALLDRCPHRLVPLSAGRRIEETARRLATIPGIGSITASLIAATVADIGIFKSARHFAAWLGLVPRQHSTGGKTRLGRITKTGNREIRRLLVIGATSMVRRAPQWNSAAGVWVRGVLQRRPVRLVTVALANKMARIAWALMTRNEVYHAKGRIVTAAKVVT